MWVFASMTWQMFYEPSIKFYLASFFIAHVIAGWIVYVKFNDFIKTLIAMSLFPFLCLFLFLFLSLFYGNKY